MKRREGGSEAPRRRSGHPGIGSGMTMMVVLVLLARGRDGCFLIRPRLHARWKRTRYFYFLLVVGSCFVEHDR